MSIAADFTRPYSRVLTVILRRTVAVVAVGCLTSPALLGGGHLSPVAEPFDPEVVLPSRVDAALHRTFAAVERSVAAVDDRRWSDARRALRASAEGFERSHKAVMHQVTAVQDPEAEDESTAGPDSALAALNVAQASVGMLSGLFDRVDRPGLVRRIDVALSAAQTPRQVLLDLIAGLDPEEAGADYVELLTDTAPQYTDEVAGIQEAIVDDRLTPAALLALQDALERSQQAEAVVLQIVGPPED